MGPAILYDYFMLLITFLPFWNPAINSGISIEIGPHLSWEFVPEEQCINIPPEKINMSTNYVSIKRGATFLRRILFNHKPLIKAFPAL